MNTIDNQHGCWALRRNPFGIRLLDDATCGECSASGERVGVRGNAAPAGKEAQPNPTPRPYQAAGQGFSAY
jgi:hypothetical protein